MLPGDLTSYKSDIRDTDNKEGSDPVLELADEENS